MDQIGLSGPVKRRLNESHEVLEQDVVVFVIKMFLFNFLRKICTRGCERS